jgi:hypothetical protein
MHGIALRDLDIRLALHERLERRHGHDPDARVVDEMGVLTGECRVDVAVINGRLEGFEIKSERDTLERLPRQIEAYGQVFDRMTMVCAERHLARVEEMVPSWWGIEVVSRTKSGWLRLIRSRPARANPCVETEAVAQLLWRAEALATLERVGAADGLRSKPRRILWTALASAMPKTELRREVRERLRARRDWLAAG